MKKATAFRVAFFMHSTIGSKTADQLSALTINNPAATIANNAKHR